MRQGRPRVSSVFGEFLLVVLGVLVALAADSWMDRSRDADLERQYVEELADALRSDTAEIRSSMEHSAQRTALAQRVLAVLQGSERVDNPGEFIVSVYMGGQFNIPESETAVFDELLSSGRLLLLHDAQFRRRLLAYYRRLDHPANDRWRNTIWYRYRPIAAQALSLEAQRWADAVLYRGASVSSVPEEVAATLDATIRQLQSVPEVEGLLREVVLAGDSQVAFWTFLLETAADLISSAASPDLGTR